MVVLGILGLFGALAAGIMAETMIGATPKPDADAEEAEEDTQEFHDLLDNSTLSGDEGAPPGHAFDGMPVSDDLEDPVDAGETLVGGGADDILTGHGGDDRITGGEGGDLLGGRDGDGSLVGGAGEDYLHGGSGNDSLSGGLGDDVVHGEDGDDLATGGAGADGLYGHSGDDTLSGDEGADTLIGGEGQDSLAGGLGDDALAGGIGDDLLMVGAGDYGTGGEGADTFSLLDIGLGDSPSQITDFDPAEDQLVVLFDPVLHPDPVLTLVQPEGSAAVMLLLDGVPVASFANGADIDLSAIRLSAA